MSSSREPAGYFSFGGAYLKRTVTLEEPLSHGKKRSELMGVVSPLNTVGIVEGSTNVVSGLKGNARFH